jgi:Tfp pilus assembly protein PilN
MRAVNLLPRDTAKQRKITQQNLPVVVGGGVGVVVIGVLALSFMSASSKVSAAQKQLDDVTQQLAATPRPAPPTPQPNSQLAGEQSARVAAVATAIGGRVAWDRILREFSLVLPDDVWISSLALTPENGLSIAGTTYSHESVARLLERLALVPELSNIVLASSTAAGGSDATATTTGTTGSSTPAVSAAPVTVSFSITAKVALPPGTAAVTAPPPPPPAPAPAPATTGTTAGVSQ